MLCNPPLLTNATASFDVFHFGNYLREVILQIIFFLWNYYLQVDSQRCVSLLSHKRAGKVTRVIDTSNIIYAIESRMYQVVSNRILPVVNHASRARSLLYHACDLFHLQVILFLRLFCIFVLKVLRHSLSFTAFSHYRHTCHSCLSADSANLCSENRIN